MQPPTGIKNSEDYKFYRPLMMIFFGSSLCRFLLIPLKHSVFEFLSLRTNSLKKLMYPMASFKVSTFDNRFSYGSVGMCALKPSKASLMDCILFLSRRFAACRCWICCWGHLFLRLYLCIRLLKKKENAIFISKVSFEIKRNCRPDVYGNDFLKFE